MLAHRSLAHCKAKLHISANLLWSLDISKTLTHSFIYSHTLCQGWQWNTKPQQIWRPNFDECKFPLSSAAPFTTLVSPLPNILSISVLCCSCFIRSHVALQVLYLNSSWCLPYFHVLNPLHFFFKGRDVYHLLLPISYKIPCNFLLTSKFLIFLSSNHFI